MPREGIGGTSGGPLTAGEHLPCRRFVQGKRLSLAAAYRPRYGRRLTVRLIPGYQHKAFARLEKRRFFGGPFEIASQSDRMGYRLLGNCIGYDGDPIVSEGICPGAVQVPPDGNPIVLLNDRQTIGGYPKIGAALPADLAMLGQMAPGGELVFAPVTPHTARRAREGLRRYLTQTPLANA